jgi:hypothetical protein
MPGPEERMEWKGLAAGLRKSSITSRGLAGPETEGATLAWAFAWASGTLAFSLRRVVSAFYDISSEAIAC